ncbi:hypothetical protein BDA99DRAFT_536963 [Phascolomyces articulosus]|uniref:Uncharacterized protein n=1 Tax=Phascolomyces articulosus TaxID=60185 RepID=A0AAD5K137_9FUNG|nr:hypothetical protein BDA99DRAFT_536963 [Phascolomyces articulosus]
MPYHVEKVDRDEIEKHGVKEDELKEEELEELRRFGLFSFKKQCRLRKRRQNVRYKEDDDVLSDDNFSTKRRGLYVWCQGCNNGGHLEHIREWFNSGDKYPWGCDHSCTLSSLVTLWSPASKQTIQNITNAMTTL